MTNDEARMTKEIRMTNDETISSESGTLNRPFVICAFVICAFVICAFVICAFVILSSFVIRY